VSVRYELDGPVVIVTIDRPEVHNAVDPDTAGQWAMGLDDAMRAEYRGGIEVVRSGESQAGARRFSEGAGRHGN
jgi:1,4-dihydroxy-2-naphthoyl-CoA synthase